MYQVELKIISMIAVVLVKLFLNKIDIEKWNKNKKNFFDFSEKCVDYHLHIDFKRTLTLLPLTPSIDIMSVIKVN